MSTNDSVRPDIEKIITIMKDNYELKTFFALFHFANPTMEEMKLIVDNISNKNCHDVMKVAILFNLLSLA